MEPELESELELEELGQESDPGSGMDFGPELELELEFEFKSVQQLELELELGVELEIAFFTNSDFFSSLEQELLSVHTNNSCVLILPRITLILFFKPAYSTILSVKCAH